jgi:V/A-type H+-transporting ATPase subunit D
MRDVKPTRSAALELAEECTLMRQGYEFLDEKRMLLAGDLLRQLEAYRRISESFATEMRIAAGALQAAVERDGFDNLQIYPAPPALVVGPASHSRAFLGVALMRVEPSEETARIPLTALDPSPETESCRAAFERLLRAAADMGAQAGNLYRLEREYRFAERRAKVLENVMLPEIKEAIRRVEEQLDALDREESIRARWSKCVSAWGSTTMVVSKP